MKNIIVFIILFSTVDIFAQKVEFVSGLNYNIFYSGENFSRYDVEYSSEIGYAIKVAFENENESIFKWRAEIGFEKYGGSLNAFDGGFGGGNRVEAEINKSIFTFAIYPLSGTLWDKIDVNLGFEISKLFRDNNMGTNTTYSSFSSTQTITDLNTRYPSYNTNFNFGIRGRIAYNFSISEKLILSPQISYFFGNTSEFKELPRQTKSMRPFFGIGLKKRL